VTSLAVVGREQAETGTYLVSSRLLQLLNRCLSGLIISELISSFV